ncbi:MAG TPA: HAMP domain-containing sensor histidine kinase [Candidatus Limnocylindria bacterium]|nr:HAMP domain-containing sensor histidine kinase [Candidatus Limnocylindria bacterium]
MLKSSDMAATGTTLPDLETHFERQMRTTERQLALARAVIAGAGLAAILLFRDRLDSFPLLVGLAVAVLVYTGAILLLVGRFPAREVGIVATALDMVVVTLAVYVEPQAVDAFLFYVPVLLGVAVRFGLGASVWASLVVCFMYASVVLAVGGEGLVRQLLPIRIGYLVGLGLAAGLFARVVIGRVTENARLQLRLEQEERDQERRREAELLSQMAREFGTSLDRQATVDAIVRAAAPLLGDLTWLLTVEDAPDGGAPVLRLAGVEGRDGDATRMLREHLEARRPRVGDGVAGAAAATVTPAVVRVNEPPPDSPGDPDGMRLLGLRSMLAVPIISRQRVRGVLVSASTTGPDLGDGEARLAAAIAERAGPALENASLWADLQEQVAREQRAQRAKDDFLSIVSHELRTPLTSIQGYSQLLEARLADSGGTKEISQIGTIRAQVARMRRLVEDLLDVSRIDRRGLVSIEPEPLDLAAEIRDAAARTERDHPERQLVVQAPDTLPITADPDRIGQVLTNLLDNAIKYSPGGGAVTVTAEARGDGVELAVADEGIGLGEGQPERIFERFYQVDDGSGARRPGGLGLGLYITRAIVLAHGGQISAEPNRAAGRGTVIRVRLPRTARIPAGMQPVTDAPPPFVTRRG